MAKYWVILFIVIAVVSGGLILINKLGQEAKIAFAAKPWIEVISPSVAEVDEKGAIKRELVTGDELSAGNTIEGKAGSYANIYFPDGSAARIDGATKITIDDYLFDEGRDQLVVRLSVVTGRLWNKIFELATPDSVWEVKTANAVATVRGTAFGVEVSDGKSGFIGSQNNVEIFPVNPETKEIIKETKAVIAAGDVLEITKDEIQKARREKKAIALKVQKVAGNVAAAAVAARQDWVSRAKAADAAFDNQISALREVVKEKSELRREIRETIKKVKDEVRQKTDEGNRQFDALKSELKQRINQLPVEKKSDILGKVNQLNGPAGRAIERVIQDRLKLSDESVDAIKRELNDVVGETKTVSTSIDQNNSIASPTAAPKTLSKPSKIILELTSELPKAVKEGTRVFFKAIVMREDGSSMPVTDTAEWRVIGSIGVMEKPGVFLSRLGNDVSEFGTGFGTITVTWKDSLSGESFLAQSSVITVESDIAPVFVPDGG